VIDLTRATAQEAPTWIEHDLICGSRSRKATFLTPSAMLPDPLQPIALFSSGETPVSLLGAAPLVCSRHA